MKRSEPLWKRKAARQYCKEQYDKVWGKLSKRPLRYRYTPPGVSVYVVDNSEVVRVR